MKTIFFGNGFNLLNGYSTWDDLLKKIVEGKEESRIPNTLQFEAEVLSLPEREPVVMTYNGEVITYYGVVYTYTMESEKRLKAEIASEMKQYASNDLYRRIASMEGVSHYVTSNYDDVLARSLKDDGFLEYAHSRNENIYSIRRRVSLQKSMFRSIFGTSMVK